MGQALRKFVEIDRASAERLSTGYPFWGADGKLREDIDEVEQSYTDAHIHQNAIVPNNTRAINNRFVHDAAYGALTITDPAATSAGNVYDDGTPIS